MSIVILAGVVNSVFFMPVVLSVIGPESASTDNDGGGRGGGWGWWGWWGWWWGWWGGGGGGGGGEEGGKRVAGGGVGDQSASLGQLLDLRKYT